MSAEPCGLTHQVIGAAMEVHRILGPGLLESIYEEALGVELSLLGIPFKRQVAVRETPAWLAHHVQCSRTPPGHQTRHP